MAIICWSFRINSRNYLASSSAGVDVGNLVTAGEQEQIFHKSTAIYVFGLCGKVLVVGETHKRLLWEDTRLPTCQRQVQPAPKWTHHYTADPISDSGGISVIIHLRKGEEHCSGAVKEWGEENMKQSRWVKGWEEVLQAWEQPMGEDHSDTGWLPASCGGPPTVKAEDRLRDNRFFEYYSYRRC